MLKNAKKLYEKYKKTKVTVEDLKKAGKLKDNLGAVATKFELLVRMVKSDRRGEFKIPAMDKVKIVGAIIYVISTIDAVPDILPIIGFGDDIGVVAYVISKLGNLISEYVKNLKCKCKRKKKKVKILIGITWELLVKIDNEKKVFFKIFYRKRKNW